MRRVPARSLVPVVTLTGVDADEMALTTPGVLMALPEPASVRYELDMEAGAIRRVVSTMQGITEDEWVAMEHLCMTCALRFEIAPTVARLAETGLYGSLLLTLPPTAVALPIVRALESTQSGSRQPSPVRVAAVVSVTPGPSLEDDLLGDDLLCERYDGLDHDRRSVGEVMADQLELADLVISSDGPFTDRGRALLDELLRPDSRVLDDSALVTTKLLLDEQRDIRESSRHLDPVRRTPRGLDRYSADGHAQAVSLRPESGVWTVYLDTWKPLHPERLHANLEALGSGRVRGRGCFWLPGRPSDVAEWSGAGGQLSIGSVGSWGRRPRRTRLVITGVGGSPQHIVDLLDQTVITDAEMARGRAAWHVGDGFDPWLGDFPATA